MARYDSTIRRVRIARQEALGNLARKRWANLTNITEGYLSGRGQVPDASEDDYIDLYRTVNFEKDLTNRVAAMLSGGRTDFVATDHSGGNPVMVQLARALLQSVKKSNYLSGVMFEWAYNGVAYNVGAIRTYFDPSRMIERGGFIGMEIPHPLMVWVSPFARDPYHPLLGSEYVGFETLERRGDLIRRYPEKARKLRAVPRYQFEYGEEGNDNFDPVASIVAPSVARQGKAGVAPDSWVPASVGETDAGENENRDDDLIRVTEFCYESTIDVEVGEGIPNLPVTHWRWVKMAGNTKVDAPESDACVIQEDEPVPYGLPPVVLFVYQRSLSSPYGEGGVPNDIHTLQDSYNVVFNSVINRMQEDDQWADAMIGRAGVLDERTKGSILAGQPQRYLEVDPEERYGMLNIDQIITRLKATDPDWSKKVAVLDRLQDIMRTVAGVNSSVIGDIDLAKRTSGVALHSSQQATLVAQEAARQHLNAAAGHLANLIWAMVKYHWIVPQKVMLPNGTEVDINQRIPVTPETTAMVEQLLALPVEQQIDEQGRPLVPTAIHIAQPDGDEMVIPLAEQGLARAAIAQAGADAEYSLNYVPMLDLELDMVVEADEAERSEKARGMMAWADSLTGGTWSWETKVAEAKKSDPYWSVDLERSRLFGDQIAKVLTDVKAQGGPQAQQMIMQAIVGALQQIQQGATAGGQPPQGGAAQPPGGAGVGGPSTAGPV